MTNKIVGNGNISATIICDSISESGKRITTFELEYPRFIHSEFMTHRMISKNCASSRAIPVEKMIEQVENNPAMPIFWGKNQAGMQANEECNNPIRFISCFTGDIRDDIEERSREDQWLIAKDDAVKSAKYLAKAGYHKQIVNRLLEPFQFMKTVATATEWDNFFWLRLDKDAQPEIQELARCMYKAMENSTPELLYSGEWHLPYIKRNITKYPDSLERIVTYSTLDGDMNHSDSLSLKEALAISASCCAQVSYRATDTSKEKAMSIYNKLIGGAKVHASPFEHQATPISPETPFQVGQNGITSEHKILKLMSGNFSLWLQHRQLLTKYHTCWCFKETK